MVSVIIPINNEEPSVHEMYAQVSAVFGELRRPFELIFVDDGSTDGSFKKIEQLAARDARVKAIRLPVRCGKSAALAAGFGRAQGDIIVTMDGDLQHDPRDLPALLAKIDEGFDMITGLRVKRGDSVFTRKLPSRIAHWLMARVAGVQAADFCSSYGAFRADVLAGLHLHGDFHRMLPMLAAARGARIAEVPVGWHRRLHGASHYGFGRSIPFLLDLITARYFLAYAAQPMHLFGKAGLVGVVMGIVVGIYALIGSVWDIAGVMGRDALVVLMFIFFSAGVIFFFMGCIAEMLARAHAECFGRLPCIARETRQQKNLQK